MIENSAGEQGVLAGGSDITHPKNFKVSVKIPASYCSEGGVETECKKTTKVVPGNYQIYLRPWAKTSNKVSLKIVNDTSSVDPVVTPKPISRIYDVIVPTGVPATLIKGETYKIMWSAQGLEGVTYGVTLHASNGETLAVIANPNLTERSIAWKVPATMSDLANAYIEVSSNGITGKTTPFRVTSYVDTLASITVVSPNGGTGSELERGTTFNIYWKASDSGVVDLSLKNIETGKVDIIATGVNGNKGGNSYTYKIPESQALGRYKVVVTAKLGASDESDNPFSIVTPRPKIVSLSPRGVYVGDMVTIKGSGFTGVTADTVFIANQQGSIGPKALTSVTPEQVVFVVPNVPAGSYRVSLLSNSGATNVVDMIVLDPATKTAPLSQESNVSVVSELLRTIFGL